jgi:hypothetical protein
VIFVPRWPRLFRLEKYADPSCHGANGHTDKIVIVPESFRTFGQLHVEQDALITPSGSAMAASSQSLMMIYR